MISADSNTGLSCNLPRDRRNHASQGVRSTASHRGEVAAFATGHIAPSATVVSDGLWCFGAATLVGAEHERHVTGGGKVSVKLPQFKAINTLLGKRRRWNDPFGVARRAIYSSCSHPCYAFGRRV